MERVKLSVLFTTLFLTTAIFAETNTTTVYTVDSVTDGSRFVIGGEEFTSEDYCFGVRAGDKVTFREGGPGTFCHTAVLQVERNGQVCKVDCE